MQTCPKSILSVHWIVSLFVVHGCAVPKFCQGVKKDSLEYFFSFLVFFRIFEKSEMNFPPLFLIFIYFFQF